MSQGTEILLKHEPGTDKYLVEIDSCENKAIIVYMLTAALKDFIERTNFPIEVEQALIIAAVNHIQVPLH